MGYYQGDFYAGARGDPFWGALLSGATKIFQKVSGVGQKILAKGGGIMPGGNLPQSAIHRVVESPIGKILIKHPVLSAAGAAGALGAIGGAGAERMMMAGGACPKGFHISHSKHAKSFGRCVRNRRMNVANGRALSRAVRRLHHFAKKYRKVVGFVSPRKPKGRMYFRKKKRAA